MKKDYTYDEFSEFEAIYQDLYNKNINKLEKIRRNVKIRTIIQSIFIAFVCIQMENFGTENFIVNKQLGLFSILIVVVLLYFNARAGSKYKKIYKEDIVSNLVRKINNQLEYKETSEEFENMKEEYIRSGFDNQCFNRYYPDDYIEGFIDNDIFIKMANLRIEIVMGSGKSGYREELFNGIFSHTRFGKEIGAHIKITKNKNKIFENKDIVEMDSAEFEKYFDIYSDNKNITMQLLTSDTMMMLIDFYNKYKINYEIVIKNNSLYMRFFTGTIFEPRIFGKSIDKDLLLEYFCILKFIIDITEKFHKVLQEI